MDIPEKRHIYKGFLALHSHKATTTSEPIAHIAFHPPDGILPPHLPLVRMTREDVASEMDTSSELVRWLLRQMSTYDHEREKIVALVFDRKTVLSDVLRGQSV